MKEVFWLGLEPLPALEKAEASPVCESSLSSGQPGPGSETLEQKRDVLNNKKTWGGGSHASSPGSYSSFDLGPTSFLRWSTGKVDMKILCSSCIAAGAALGQFSPTEVPRIPATFHIILGTLWEQLSLCHFRSLLYTDKTIPSNAGQSILQPRTSSCIWRRDGAGHTYGGRAWESCPKKSVLLIMGWRKFLNWKPFCNLSLRLWTLKSPGWEEEREERRWDGSVEFCQQRAPRAKQVAIGL